MIKGKVDGDQTQRVVVNLYDWQGDPGVLQRQFTDKGSRDSR